MIIPKPKQYEELGELTVSCAIYAAEELKFGKKAFKRIFKKVHKLPLADNDKGIKVMYDASLEEEEYRIEGASVYASSLFGMKNGLASLLQLITKVDGENITLTEAKVSDKPDRDFRCVMVDLARQWHDFDVLLGYVDMCYVNKVKYLQLHFTDDQSFTYPYKCMPHAATKGRHYTQEEIIYLVEYAHEAAVELIPEYEGIGHSRELIKNCPEEFGNEYDQPMNEKIMCVGKPKTFSYVQQMLAELADTFKYSRYIHVGCDEALHTNWPSCHYCRDYMKRHGIETSLELYAYFASKIVDMCIALGRTPIVWEGFGKEFNHLFSKDTIVVSWENMYQFTPDILAGGFKTVNAAWRPLYFVPSEDPLYRRGLLKDDFNLFTWDNYSDKSFAHGGYSIEPTDQVIGAMLCQWECTYEQEHDRLVANIPVFSDRTWNVSGYYTKKEFPSLKGLTKITNSVY